MKNKLLACAFSLLFFVFGLLTVGHYGVSWDEPEHFMRGQAYLRLFLTGQKTYKDLPSYNLALARSDPGYHERSYYQHDLYSGETWLVADSGHPPLNDILAALFNNIFYQKLGLLGDIESYHLFSIFIGAVLVGVVFLFAAQAFSVWAGIFSATFLATYPLFWAESHFNIKDPVQATFFVLSVFLFWKGIGTKKAKFFLLSSVLAGMALAVKFNILFLPFIVGPWLLLILVRSKKVSGFIFSKNVLLAFLVFPFIMFGILFVIWPFLWQDVLGNTLSVFSYYKELGTEKGFSLNPFSSWNLYATQWILYTTPPLTIICFFIGLVTIKRIWLQANSVFVLWVLLFFVTVLRVSFPNTTIYGGVRQIMEYIPALALVAGVGADSFRRLMIGFLRSRWGQSNWFNPGWFLTVLLLGILPLWRLHPNENVYFNFLIGGLTGAVKENIPASGNSYGNAYLQTVRWLNANAEEGANVALIQGTSLNIVTADLRRDLNFSNNSWSGIYREGEYLVELTPHNSLKLYPYAWEYIEKFLDPVYEVRADGIAIAKIWKNDLGHTKPEMRKSEVLFTSKIGRSIKDQAIVLDIGSPVTLSRLEIFSGSKCKLTPAQIYTSLKGIDWKAEEDKFPVVQVNYREQPQPSAFFFFAAKDASFIKIDTQGDCLLTAQADIKLRILQ